MCSKKYLVNQNKSYCAPILLFILEYPGQSLDVLAVYWVISYFSDSLVNIFRAGLLGDSHSYPSLLHPGEDVPLVYEDRHAHHGHAVVDGLQDPVHPTVGDEYLGAWVCQDCLLRYPRNNQHIARCCHSPLLTCKFHDNSLW